MPVRKLKSIILLGIFSIVLLIVILSNIIGNDRRQAVQSSNSLNFANIDNIMILSAQNGQRKTEKSRVMAPGKLPFEHTTLTADTKAEMLRMALEEMDLLAKKEIDEKAYANPKTILIATTWRSGSTFFAEAVSQHPAIFYHYEPLTGYELTNYNNESEVWKEAIATIKNLINCDYTDEKYLDTIKSDNSLLDFNNKIKKPCRFVGDQCFQPFFLTQVCSLFPIQLFKIVRAHIADLLPIIESNLHTHVIFLVRDPRATFASRLKLKWCQDSSTCGDPDSFCDFLTTDLLAFSNLQHQFPDQVHLVKFEDLALNSTDVLKELFSQLGIEWHKAIDQYLVEHTTANLEEPWSTHRISRLRVDSWKSSLATEMVGYLQEKCDAFMSELNYSQMDVSLCKQFCS